MGISRSLRDRVIERDGLTCAYCGIRVVPIEEYPFDNHYQWPRPNAEVGFGLLTIDHKLPKSKGGSDALSNLAIACKECNGGKSNYTPSELRRIEKRRRRRAKEREKEMNCG